MAALAREHSIPRQSRFADQPIRVLALTRVKRSGVVGAGIRTLVEVRIPELRLVVGGVEPACGTIVAGIGFASVEQAGPPLAAADIRRARPRAPYEDRARSGGSTMGRERPVIRRHHRRFSIGSRATWKTSPASTNVCSGGGTQTLAL
jgi:hypothetical protein